MRSVVRVVVGGAAVLACAAQAPSLALDARSTVDPPYRVYYGADVISDPMSATAPRPNISARQAIAAISAGDYRPVEPGEPETSLRMVTLTESPSTAGHPAWVLIWSNVSRMGHGKVSTSPRPLTIDHHATAIEIVDATTGQVAPGAWVLGANTITHA